MLSPYVEATHLTSLFKHFVKVKNRAGLIGISCFESVSLPSIRNSVTNPHLAPGEPHLRLESVGHTPGP